MNNSLERAIDLARKTGDRLIVADSVKSDKIYVVMSLDEYEKLVIGKSEVRNLTEDELLDKINRDVAVWKSENENYRDYKWPARNPAIRKENNDFMAKNSDNVDDFLNNDDELYYYNTEKLNDSFGINKDTEDADGDYKDYDYNTFMADKAERQNASKSHWQIPSNIKVGAVDIE